MIKAEFLDLEGPIRDIHIADVSHNRVFLAISHNETSVNLYVSTIVNDKDGIFQFQLSLRGVLTFFPNSTWKDSWLR